MTTTTSQQQTKAPAVGHAAPAPARAAVPVVTPELPEIPALQDAIGNRAVGSLLEGGGELIQRNCSGCASSGTTCSGCADEELRRAAVPGAQSPSSLPPAVTAALGSIGGRGLDPSTRFLMESRFGQSFGGVRIYTDDGAGRAADAIDASAFTVGNRIWFGRGQFDPGTGEGLHLLAHELTHTVQQRGRSAGAQASLRVGSVSDPAEFAADRAAEAVLGGRPLARIGSSGTVIRRKPKVSPVAGNTAQRIVELDDGKKYRVTRRVDWVKETKTRPEDEFNFGAKITKERVWLQVDTCSVKNRRRTSVQVGANVPAAAQKVLKDAGAAVLRGDDPLPVLKGAEVEPFVGVTVAESKKYRVTAETTVKVKPGEGEVTGGGLKGSLETPQGKFSLEGSINKPPPGQDRPEGRVELKFEKTFGGPGEVKCKDVTRTTLEPRISYSCEEYVPEHIEDKPTPVTLKKVAYLYFKYAEPEWATKSNEPGTKRNPAEMEGLRRALADGYKVTAITGHASPEGPMEPAKRFMGNLALSEARAKRAKEFVEAECPKPGMLSMREEQSCFEGEVKPTGQGELYSGGTEPELKGKKLAETAVTGFKEAQEPVEATGEEGREARHATPEITKALEARKGSVVRQAEDVVYPLLRRAEVHLRKREIQVKPQKVEAEWKPSSCLPAVLDAADEDFAKTPLQKPKE